MGFYSEYLNQNLSFEEITKKRKEQLVQISALRGGRDILVYAADLTKSTAPVSIDFSDRLPIHDQLANLKGKQIDLILETPGGSGEVAEDIVRAIRQRYDNVSVLIPGSAMSAGTIIAMSADEILMEPSISSLGPIDAQLFWQGKKFSAQALIDGVEKIKAEVDRTGRLNPAYIPILQALSPGEIEHAQNALNFAKVLVTDWLANYKFRDWEQHASSGQPVTTEEKRVRAAEVAHQLCDHGHWKTHGKSIKLSDLEDMRLRITDFSKLGALNEAIQRYYTLLQMSFETNIYKIIETPESQIYRFAVSGGQPTTQEADTALVNIQCHNCGRVQKVQANLREGVPLEQDAVAFPKNNLLRCSGCGAEMNLSDVRRNIEAQAKRGIVD